MDENHVWLSFYSYGSMITETVKDVYDAMNEKQKAVVAFMIGQALENAKKDDKADSRLRTPLS